MAASFVFDQGRDAFNWEAGLFNVDGNDGIFSDPRELAEADGSGLGSAHIDFNDWHLTFTSAGNDLTVASGDLTGGTVTSITLRSGSTSVIHLTGLSVSAATVQALLDGGAENGRDPLFLAVFASEATTFQGPPEGAMSAFGSAASDEYFLSAGGPDYVFNFIWTGGGVDTVHGSDGEDFVAYDVDQAVTVNFADGTVVKADTTSLGTFDDEVEDIAGSKFGDTFNGDDRDNRMFGNEGDDTFTGGDGDDFFVGGANDDLIDGGDGWDRLDFLMSVDQEQGVVVTYAAGTDFSGTATDSWGDTDTFSNIEDVRGGNFDDVFNGNDADNNFEGEGGNDTLNGGGGYNYLNGGDGDDSLTGGSGNNDYEGGQGDDTFIGGITGDDNWDKLYYSSEDGGHGIKVTYSGAGGVTVKDTYGDTDTGTGIEQIKGSRYNDTFNGSNRDNRAEGMDGADTFKMGGGWDEVSYVNEKHDDLTHGVIVNLSGASISVNIGFGNKTVASGRAIDTFGKTDKLSGVERVIGTETKDHIVGGNGKTEFEGRGGNDKLIGNGGEDTFEGDNGKDTIDAGTGDDHMNGGQGKDLLTGGAGEDDFNFAHMGKANADTITDFTSGEDEIWLWDDVFGLGSGKLLKAKQFYAADGADEATKASHRVIYDTKSGKLWFDEDGSKDGHDPSLVAILKGGPELHASDIQLG